MACLGGLGGIVLVARRGSRRLDELCRCLEVLRGLPGRRAAVVLVVEDSTAWVLRFAGAGDDSVEVPINLKDAAFEADAEKALLELFERFAQGLSLEVSMPGVTGPLAIKEAAALSLHMLGGSTPSVLVHLHELACTKLSMGSAPDGHEITVHAVLGVHEDTPDEVLSAMQEAAAELCPPMPCMALALGARPLHSSATLQLLVAHAGWLSDRISLVPDTSRGLHVDLGGAAGMEPRSMMHIFVPVPGTPPVDLESDPADIFAGMDLVARRVVHLAVTSGLVWSHGAYLETEVRLSLVWGDVALTLDRSCLDAFPSDDRAPREANIVRAALKKARDQGRWQTYQDALVSSVQSALASTVAPMLYQLCIPAVAGTGGEVSAPGLPKLSAGKARLPPCPLSDAPVFCFLGGLEPFDQPTYEGRRLEVVRWPPCGAGLSTSRGDSLLLACTIYALHHIHTEGCLLPALEVPEEQPRPEAISVREAFTRAAAWLPAPGEPHAQPPPGVDVLGDSEVVVRFRIATRHSSQTYLFAEAEPGDGLPSGALQGGDPPASGTLQVCALRKTFEASGLMHHFSVLQERTRVGDLLEVAGRCGLARGTGKPTLFMDRVLRVELRHDVRAAGPIGEANASGDPLIVYQLDSGLLAAHKAAGTSTFWPMQREKGRPKPSAVAGRGGAPLVKLLEDWAASKAIGPLHCVSALKTDPSGLVLFARRGSDFATVSSRHPAEPCRRFVALVAGRLPSSEERGRFGPIVRCKEPLRQLGSSANSAQPGDPSQTSGEQAGMPICSQALAGRTGESVGVRKAPSAEAAEESAVKPVVAQASTKGQRKPPKLPALTEIETLYIFGEDVVPGAASLVIATPKTKVAEQVRRHLLHLSCPVCGDKQFGDFRTNRRFTGVFGLPRIFIHCAEIEVPESWAASGSCPPVLRCPLPQELRSFLESLLARDPHALPDEVASWIGLHGRA
mmetsp:Transcript_135501/g.433422  ORF Transcript_135501/g.433422 Transcript_135501/m.433422 type:complete len:961 (-) Transcript_135501:1-2883(-)